MKFTGVKYNPEGRKFPLHNKPSDMKDLDVFNIKPLNKMRRKIRKNIKDALSNPSFLERALEKLKK